MLFKSLLISIEKQFVFLFLLCFCIAQGQNNPEFTQAQKEYEAGNFAEALEWYELAAEKGDAQSMYHLGWMFENGEGIDVDRSIAMEWYRKAMAKGHTDAMLALGVMYFNNDRYVEAEIALLPLQIKAMPTLIMCSDLFISWINDIVKPWCG